MRLYAGPSTHSIRDTTHNQIAEKLRTAFFDHYRRVPSPNEVQSWQNSLRATAMVFQEAELNDHGVILEYQLPLSSRRLDCIVTGHDRAAGANAVIMELKQWSAVDGASVVGDKVVTWVGGGHRDVLHPSVQAGQYRQYLEDSATPRLTRLITPVVVETLPGRVTNVRIAVASRPDRPDARARRGICRL